MEQEKEFQIDGYTVVLRNYINGYTGKAFAFYIINEDGTCLLIGDGIWQENLDKELARKLLDNYLNPPWRKDVRSE